MLEALPEWFGIPASIDAYVSAAGALPMLACFDADGEVAGFVSVKPIRPSRPKSMSWLSNAPGTAAGLVAA